MEATNVFLQSRAVTLFFDTQKNCFWGKSTTMEATNIDNGNPVSAAARLFLHLHQHNTYPETTICLYFTTTGIFIKSVTSTNIVSLL